MFREFATPAETSGFFGEVRNLVSQLAGLMLGNPKFTDNASVNLAAVDAAAARSGSSGSSSGGKLLLAMSETPAASYLVNPDDLSTVEQVRQAAGYQAGDTTITILVISNKLLKPCVAKRAGTVGYSQAACSRVQLWQCSLKCLC